MHWDDIWGLVDDEDGPVFDEDNPDPFDDPRWTEEDYGRRSY